MDNKNEYFENNLAIFSYALKNWKLLIGVAIISAVLAGVFSSPKFIAPQYTSEAVIYPANLGEYAEETGVEQMQQYLESNAIREKIIAKFNLYDEYEIDSTHKSSRTAIYKVYSDQIGFRETKYESIELTATSIDPQKSKEILEEILRLINETIRNTERKKYWEIVLINKRMMQDKLIQVDSLEKLIRDYSTKYGLLDYISQSEEVTEGYMKFLLSGKKGNDFIEAKKLYENLEKYGRHFHNLHAQLNEANGEYLARLKSYEHSMKDFKKVQTYTNVIVKPEAPDKKSYPIRWLIVLSAMATATIFTFVVLLIFGYKNK